MLKVVTRSVLALLIALLFLPLAGRWLPVSRFASPPASVRTAIMSAGVSLPTGVLSLPIGAVLTPGPSVVETICREWNHRTICETRIARSSGLAFRSHGVHYGRSPIEIGAQAARSSS